MSSAAIASVHAIHKLSQKCLTQKVVHFGSLGWIPMIQVPFNSSCVALQYEIGTKFFHWAVPELYGIKNQKISVQHTTAWYLLKVFSSVWPSDNPRMSNNRLSSVHYEASSFREEALSSRWIVSFCGHSFQGLKVGSQVCMRQVAS